MKKIAILGFGTIGGGIADVIDTNRKEIQESIGDKIEISYILDLRKFPDSPYRDAVTDDFNKILADPGVSVIAETMGGAHPAYDFSLAALKAGKNVVTSNKEVVAKFGKELLAAARENGVRYLFEASVGGGIPIIRSMVDSLAGNKICSVEGILNGTTNYILTEMSENGKSFETALSEAQAKGYAEKNPSADIEGIDAKRKICILSAIAYGKMYTEDIVPSVGISRVDLADVAILEKIGAKIKLVGSSFKNGDGVCVFVEPCAVRKTNPLCSVDGVYNGILVNGNALGTVMFYGSGAGKLPTASAVVSDILDIMLNPGKSERLTFETGDADELISADGVKYDYYVRTDKSLSGFDCTEISDGAYIVKGTDKNTIKSALKPAAIYKIL